MANEKKFEHVFANLDGTVDGESESSTFAEDENGNVDFFRDVPRKDENKNPKEAAADAEPGDLSFGDDLPEVVLEDDPAAAREPGDEQPPRVDPMVAELRRDLDDVRNQLANERVQQQVAGFNAQLDGAERHVSGELDKANLALEKARKDYKEAAEKGDTDAELKAQEAIADARFAINTFNQHKGEIAEARKRGPQIQQQAREPHEETKKWLQQNPWFSDPSQTARAAAAREIDAVLKREGIDPKTPDFYKKLDERMAKQFKPLAKQGGASERPPTVSTSQTGASASPRPKPGKVTLTRADFSSMEKFGLDPRNPAHQREWARNKMTGGR